MNKKIGLIFLMISIILFIIPSISITGNIIAEKFLNNSYFFISGLIFLFISFLILASRQSLDAIIIPTGPSIEIGKERADIAAEAYKERQAKLLLISGKDSAKKDSQRYAIYKELRRYGIKPGEIRIEHASRDTIENILFSLKKIKERGLRDIGIASNPSHLDRFEMIIERAKKEGIIDDNFKIYRLETKETFGESVYGFFANLFNRYKLRHGIEKSSEYKTPSWISSIGGYVFNLSRKK